MGILGTLTGKKPPTSDTLRAAITKAETDRAQLAPVLESLAERRRSLLLGDDEAALDEVERDQAATVRHADRLEIAIEELRTRLGAAEEREEAERVEAIYRRGAEMQAREIDGLRRYGKLASHIRDVLAELAVLEEERNTINTALAGAGDSRRFDAPERAITEPGAPGHGRICSAVVLPSEVNSLGKTIWPLNRAEEKAEVLAAARERVAR